MAKQRTNKVVSVNTGDEVEVPMPTPVEIPAAQPAAADAPKSRRYLVSLAFIKPAIVEASGEAEAWERFKEFNGITASDHKPEITEVTDSDNG